MSSRREPWFVRLCTLTFLGSSGADIGSSISVVAVQVLMDGYTHLQEEHEHYII